MLASIIENWDSVIDFQGYKITWAAELRHELGSNASNPMLYLKLSCALVLLNQFSSNATVLSGKWLKEKRFLGAICIRRKQLF